MNHRFVNDGQSALQFGPDNDFACICGARGAHAIIAAHIAEAMPIGTTEPLRLRMKVWTDPVTAKRYLMPTAFMRDVVNGKPVGDAMIAYAMRDDDTKLVTLTGAEWNTLPFYYFEEDGVAPRATARPVDVIP